MKNIILSLVVLAALVGVNLSAQPGPGSGPFFTGNIPGNAATATTATNLANVPQYNIFSYGAYGNGIVLQDAIATSNSPTITSASAHFLSSDTGKVLTVKSAGPMHINLFTNVPWGGNGDWLNYTTNYMVLTNWYQTNYYSFTAIITNVVSANSVQVSGLASHTVTATNAMYGNDDTAIIQAALNDIVTNKGGVGALYFPPAIYVINGPLQDTNGGVANSWTNHHWAQIIMPPFAGTNGNLTYRGFPSPTITIQGACKPDGAYIAPTVWSSSGTILWSTLPFGDPVNIGRTWDTRNFVSGYGGRGCDSTQPYYRNITDMNDIGLVFDSVTVRECFDNGMMGIDADGANYFGFNNSLMDGDESYWCSICPANTNTWGIWFPNSWGDESPGFNNSRLTGFYNGINATHQVHSYASKIYSCWNAITTWNGGDHTSVFLGMDIQHCKNIVSSGGAGGCGVSIWLQFTFENSTFPWEMYPILVNDGNSIAATVYGHIEYDAQHVSQWSGNTIGGAFPMIGLSARNIEVHYVPLYGTIEPGYITPPLMRNGIDLSSDPSGTNVNDPRLRIKWAGTVPGSWFFQTGIGQPMLSVAGGSYLGTNGEFYASDYEGGLGPGQNSPASFRVGLNTSSIVITNSVTVIITNLWSASVSNRLYFTNGVLMKVTTP